MARFKKTLSNWLNNRHILIIQNEEDFSEKATFNFTYARIVFFSFIGFVLLLVLAFYLVNTVLAQWFDPRFAEREMRKDVVSLRLSLDSLEQEMNKKDLFIQSLRDVLEGDVQAQTEVADQNSRQPVAVTENPDSREVDSLFRTEFETGGVDFLMTRSLEDLELRETFFFSPISGYISSPFAPREEHYGIDVVAKKDEPVKCVADGTVVFSSWTQDTGNVIAIQHRADLISIYKHNSALIKEIGDFVSAGEIIAIIGNTGELSDGPHLHFELWYNGKAVDPEEFINF